MANLRKSVQFQEKTEKFGKQRPILEIEHCNYKKVVLEYMVIKCHFFSDDSRSPKISEQRNTH